MAIAASMPATRSSVGEAVLAPYDAADCPHAQIKPFAPSRIVENAVQDRIAVAAVLQLAQAAN